MALGTADTGATEDTWVFMNVLYDACSGAEKRQRLSSSTMAVTRLKVRTSLARRACRLASSSQVLLESCPQLNRSEPPLSTIAYLSRSSMLHPLNLSLASIQMPSFGPALRTGTIRAPSHRSLTLPTRRLRKSSPSPCDRPRKEHTRS